MNKIVLTLLSIWLFIGLSQQINSVNPDKFVNPVCEDDDYEKPCCLQVAQVLALASSSAYAASQSCASAYAAVSAATRSIVAGATAASAGSHTSIAQTIALAQKPDTCCGISAAAGSKVNVFGGVIADAAAEAKAGAEACAAAAAQAEASAIAAAEAYAYAQSIINSKPGSQKGSCCTFADEILSAVTVVGNFVSKAASLATASVEIKAQVELLASACSEAKVAVERSTSSIVRGSIDNCCVETHVSKCANDTANAFRPVSRASRKAHGLCLDWLAKFSSFVADTSVFTISQTLVDKACSDDCRHTPIACCKENNKCCKESKQTVCLATKNVAAVSLRTIAITKAIADAAGHITEFVESLADTIASVSSAVVDASLTSVSLNLKRIDCCGFSVTFKGVSASYARSVQEATARVSTSAEALASAFAISGGVSIALSQAEADAAALSQAHGECLDCCNSKCCLKLDRYPSRSYDCCDVAGKISRSCASDRSLSVAAAAANAISFSRSIGQSTTTLKQSTSAGVIEVQGMSYSHTLKCCCCATRPNVKAAYGGKGGVQDVYIPVHSAKLDPKKNKPSYD